jgi:hypothetical protein
VTASLEHESVPPTNELIELGLLGVLTLTLAIAIYLIRRSEPEPPAQASSSAA